MKKNKKTYRKTRNERWPSTVEEAVSRLVLETTPAEKALIRSMTKSELSHFHFDLGLWIRNNFGLWRGNNKLLKACGCDHADPASGVILEALWRRLKRNYPRDLKIPEKWKRDRLFEL